MPVWSAGEGSDETGIAVFQVRDCLLVRGRTKLALFIKSTASMCHSFHFTRHMYHAHSFSVKHSEYNIMKDPSYLVILLLVIIFPLIQMVI